MEIVLAGSTGKLGGALWRAWSDRHRVHSLRRDMADFRHPEALQRALDEFSFDALVNCAAMSNPEACEAYPDEAYQVNTEAPGVLAKICHERGARLVHISTDYVLDGREPGLKDERAPTAPVNHYSLTKLEGEHRVLEHEPSAVVCRVSWVFGTTPPGFIEDFLRRAQAGEELEAVADKFSMPTSAQEIARILVTLLDRRESNGVYHVTHAGEPQSWWSSGRRILEIGKEMGLLDDVKEVRPKRLAEVARLAAPRPVHTAMKPARLAEELGWPVRSWEDAARERLQALFE